MAAASLLHAQELNIKFTTSSISGARYSPSHVIAVWVKDSTGQYVRTLMIYGSKTKKALYKWNSSSKGDMTDAVTGSTLTSFREYTLSWDMKNYKGETVPHGTYTLCIEMTSEDKQGPYAELSVQKGSQEYTLTPADMTNFKNISVSFHPQTAALNNIFDPGSYLVLYPNPASTYLKLKIRTDQDSEAEISIFSASNQLCYQTKSELIAGYNPIYLSIEDMDLVPGIYLVLVKTNHYLIGDKLLVKYVHLDGMAESCHFKQIKNQIL